MRKLLLPLLLTACRIDLPEFTADDAHSPDAEPDAETNGPFSVGGSVSGTWLFAAFDVRLNATGFPTETITLNDIASFEFDSTFTFETLVPAGTPYVVEIVVNPAHHTCNVANGVGTADADVSNISITCQDDISLELFLGSPRNLPISTDTASASFDTSVLQQSIEVSITSPPSGTVFVWPWQIGNSAPPKGELSTPSTTPLLPMGTTAMELQASVDGLRRDFNVDIDRGAAAVEQYVYRKSMYIDAGDRFGAAIDVSLDEYVDVGEKRMAFVIGAPGEDSNSSSQMNNSGTNAGAAYLFTGDHNDTGIWQMNYLKPFTPIPINAAFGSAVSISRDQVDQILVAVGAPEDDGVAQDAGAAYVFRDSTCLCQEVRLTPADGAANDRFGHSVGIGPSQVAVGAPYHGGAGAVYVYRYSGTDWVLDEVLTPPNASTGDRFGWAVESRGDRVVVSAPGEDSASAGVQTTAPSDDDAIDSGAVYVFSRASNGTWSLESFIKPSTSAAGDEFGVSMAWNASATSTTDTFVVGAPGASVLGSQGAAFVFNLANLPLTESDVLLPTGLSNGDFGRSVTMCGELAAVGTAAGSTGFVEVFRMVGPGDWDHQVNVAASNPDDGDEYGGALQLTRDRLVVGAPGESSSSATNQALNDAADAGAVYVIR